MDFRHRAVCRDVDPELFFPIGEDWTGQGARLAAAKAVCAGCPVRDECLSWALGAGLDHGVFGGLSEVERRALKARNRVA